MNPRHEQHAELLRSLSRPVLPDQLRSRDFLDSIYSRALEDAEERLSEHLGQTITQVEAPIDVDWCEPEQGTQIAQDLRQLPRRSAPGLLWPRIRADLRSLLQQRRRTRKMRYAAVAAVFLLSCLLLFPSRRSDPAERDPEINIRSIRVDAAFEDSYSPKSIVRRLTRGE